VIVISKFTDYYDQVAHTYGKDPLIRYERLEIKNTGPFEFRSLMAPFGTFRSSDYGKRPLIVGERVYTVFYKLQEYPIKYFLADASHEMFDKPSHVRRHYRNEPYYFKSSYAIELCRLIGQPVFWIENSWYEFDKDRKIKGRGEHFIKVSRNPPILCEIANFAKLYPADQIYQDLSHVMGNLMHNPPDDNPPVQVDEKVRWAKKGFDAKTSFRGK